MKKIVSITLLFVMFASVSPAVAQGETPYVVDSTRPISAELRHALDAWLAVDPPSNAFYYIVTYTEDYTAYWAVSLVGVNLQAPDEPWSLEDTEKTVWMGSVIVDKTSGQVSPFREVAKAHGLAAMRLVAGGGSYVAFPFAQGTSALYGPRGVHGSGDYGTSGMLFVDLVSGDDMGATAAPPYVFASDAGEIDYVCDDGVSVAVRTYNNSTGDYFLYAHLVDNANLVLSTAFNRGEMIGDLKYGTFQGGSPTCGWADQHANHYHVHWGFVPAAGKYQVGACILTVSTQAWQCGDQKIGVGGYLVGGGGFSVPGQSGGTSGAGATVSDPTFFDYMLGGVVGLVSRSIFDLLPSHTPMKYTYAVFNAVEFFFKIVYVLVQSNLSLKWVFIIMLYAFTVKTTLFAVSLIPLFFRAIKWLVPIFGA